MAAQPINDVYAYIDSAGNVQQSIGVTLIGGGGGGGGSSGGLTNAELRATPVPVSGPVTDAQLRATAIPVSGPLTNAQLTAVTGTAAAAAWNGTDPSATVIALLKAIHAQNVQIIMELNEISANTAPTP